MAKLILAWLGLLPSDLLTNLMSGAVAEMKMPAQVDMGTPGCIRGRR